MAKSSSDGKARRTRRVLLVGHAPLAGERLQQIVTGQKGLALCGVADDRPQALKIADVAHPDLLITELLLGDCFAWDLMKDLCALHPETKAIVTSANDSTDLVERVMRAGAAGYVTNPNTKTILDAIRRVLEGGLYLSDCLMAKFTARFLAGSSPKERPLDRLSDQELKVFRMTGEGLGIRHIALKMHVAADTVRTYRARIKEKLRLEGRDSFLQTAIHWRTE